MSASSWSAGAPQRRPGRPTSHTPPAGLDLGPGRRRVTRQDLVMYQALVGGPPQSTGGRAAGGATAAASTYQRPVAGRDPSSARRPRKAWLPRVSKVLVLQLTDCYQGISQRMGHPELRAWLLRVSSDAGRKIAQAHARLSHPSDKPRV